MARHTMSGRIRQRRNRRQFENALRTASPAMYQELLAAAARSTGVNR
ncbi:MAG TPA: hypothetical protein VJ831_07800 [Jatrophihabitantaceae bacterium]|nr:hypothetical protein [Jatrophihabitantaceae bacterium]